MTRSCNAVASTGAQVATTTPPCPRFNTSYTMNNVARQLSSSSTHSYHHKLPCHKYQRATHTNQGLQGSLAFILSFRAMAATCGCLGGHWAGFQPLPPPSFCSISTQLITRSISDCGQHQLLCFCPSTVTDNLLSNPVSSASSRNFMNQLPALACICFASFSEEPKADCAVVVLAGEGAEEDDVFSLLSPPPAILSN